MPTLWYPCCTGGDMLLDDCTYCTGDGTDNAPLCLTVTFSGWANSSCTSCASYDGSYVACGPVYTSLGYCQWSWSRETGTICSTDKEEVIVQFGTGFPWYGIRVLFWQRKGAESNLYLWFKSQTTALDCLTLSALDIPYSSRSIGITASGVSCANSGATCTITAGGAP